MADNSYNCQKMPIRLLRRDLHHGQFQRLAARGAGAEPF